MAAAEDQGIPAESPLAAALLLPLAALAGILEELVLEALAFS